MTDETPKEILCPLVDEMLRADDCIPFQDISNGLIKERNMPDKFKIKPDWRSICQDCKWQNF
jgi:hypothetical protein